MTEFVQPREIKIAAFDVLCANIHSYYALEFEERSSSDLIVVMSPNSRSALRTYPFPGDTIFLSDRKLYYYMHNPGTQCSTLAKFINSAGYKRVIFIGSSKGGTGAILWASLLAKVAPTVSVSAIGFSPQTKLYPFNENIKSLPSYMGNMQIMEKSATHKTNFARYGDLPTSLLGNIARIVVVFGSGYEMDKVEAGHLLDIPGVHLFPINISFHGSIVPFALQSSDDESVSKLAQKLAGEAKSDADLKATLPISEDQIKSELKKQAWPPLHLLLRSVMDGYMITAL